MKDHKWTIAALAITAIVYAIPMIAGYAYRGSTLVPCDVWEGIYLTRIVAADRRPYLGETLGNPYLAGHDDAPRYMPEMVERGMAWTARATGARPLAIVAISRVAFPVGIALLIAILGHALGLDRIAAATAALLATLGDPRWVLRIFDPALITTPRYYRAVSPGAHVLLLLLALVAVERLSRRATWWNAIAAGAALGVLLHTPVYYWSVALAGTAWLALVSKPPRRVQMLAALGIAAVAAIPVARNSIELSAIPAVQETLARLSVMIPGRIPDAGALPVFFVGVVALAGALILAPEQAAIRFLAPFAAAATLYNVQSILTNRHVQERHWVNCLIPLWTLLLAACLIRWPSVLRLLFALTAAIALVAVSVTAIRAAKQDPILEPLDVTKPETIRWLQTNTPKGSVILSPDLSDTLVLYTSNKVYWATLAGQHVLDESEDIQRIYDNSHWTPRSPHREQHRLHFPADYYLGEAAECSGEADAVYVNARENTCVVRMAR